MDLHTDANNFAPNESERLSISPVLLFTKDQNTRVEVIVVQWKGNKTVKVNGVNYDGNMDRGPMIFTSDVSLPKDESNYAG